LIDLDGTVADYDSAMCEQMRAMQHPSEPLYGGRYVDGDEPAYVEHRRKLVQSTPGFWRNLKPLERGFDVVLKLREIGFSLHVLTKGPTSAPSAWSEKLEWSRRYMPDAAVTVTGEKSLVYGRVLVDDWPPYFEKWLAVRPRGLVVTVAQPWNAEYGASGKPRNSRVVHYDGSNLDEVEVRLRDQFER